MWIETDSPIHHSNYSLINLIEAKERLVGNYCHLGIAGRKTPPQRYI